MIKHVVAFKLKEFDKTEEKQAALDKLKSMLMALPNSIPELLHMEVGLNFELDSKQFDLCLISHFNNLDDLEIYRVHPEHVKVGQFVKTIRVGRASVDFEC